VLLPLLALYVGFALLAPHGLAPLQDERNYLRLAHQLIHGAYASEGSSNPVQYVWHGPGLPLLVAPLLAIGLPVALIRLVGPLLLFGAVYLLRRWLALYVSERAALAGAYALGLYWPLWELMPHLHSELPAVFLVVTAGYLTSLYATTARSRHLAGAGLALGLLVLTRPELGWVVLALALGCAVRAAFRRGRGRSLGALAICAIALALCAPWLAYTHSVSGRFPLWTNAGGLSLYWMASPYPSDLGDWHDASEVFGSAALAGHRPYFAALQRLPAIERDARLERTAAKRIEKRPLLYARNVVLNAGRLWFSLPYSGKGLQLKKLYYVLPGGVLLVALVAALAALWRRRHALAPELPAFIAFGLGYLAIHLLAAADVRLLAPFVPLAIWLVVYAGTLERGERSHYETH
jgi:hypothetical protein